MKTYEDLYRDYNALQHELDKVCEERDETRCVLELERKARQVHEDELKAERDEALRQVRVWRDHAELVDDDRQRARNQRDKAQSIIATLNQRITDREAEWVGVVNDAERVRDTAEAERDKALADLERLQEGLAALTEAPLCPLAEYHAMRERTEQAERERDEARAKLLSCQRAREEAERDRDNAEARADEALKEKP